MTNFIPNKTIQVVPRDPPWIDKSLRNMLNKQNRMYKNYKKHGFKPCDKILVDTLRENCEIRIQEANRNYFNKLGNKLIDSNTSQKSYWKIINRVMNKCKAPKIPPLLVDNKYIINCKEKAEKFALYFSNQCKVIVSDSSLPNLTYLTDARIDNIPFTEDDILTLIRYLQPGKANGPDGISARMLLLCDDSVALPLKLIFQNILLTGIFPDLWKLANVNPIHKKADKQLIQNYRPISLLPICSKLFEKIVFRHRYNFLISNALLTKNQSGFRPGDSTINQLISLVT